MLITRRELMGAAMATGIVAVMPFGVRAAEARDDQDLSRIPEHTPMHPDLSMTRAAFERQLDQIFEIIRRDEPAFRIRLVAVRDGAAAAAAATIGSQSVFSAIFFGPPDEWVPEGAYLVRTPEYGPMVLFLKQGRATATETAYEAIFNRIPGDVTIEHTMVPRRREPR